MLSASKQSIEDLIVEILAKNPYSEGVELVHLIKNKRPKTVKQTVYTALGSLLKDEVVSKIGGKYFLSRVWLNKINNLFQARETITTDAVFELEEGESISYYFPSLLTCDTYWAHVFDLLIEWIPEKRPIFVWNPHEWFVIGRKKEEEDIFKQFMLKNKYALYSIGGKTELDRLFKKEWSSEHVSISVGSSVVYKDNYYLNIFDDILLEVFIDTTLAQKIEDFYQQYDKLDSNNSDYFKKLLSEKYKIRMKISRNAEKAKSLRKKLAKDFYIPRNLQII